VLLYAFRRSSKSKFWKQLASVIEVTVMLNDNVQHDCPSL